MCEPKILKLYVHMYFVPNYILNLVKSQKLGVTEFYDRLIFSLVNRTQNRTEYFILVNNLIALS